MSKRKGLLKVEQEKFVVETLLFWFKLKKGFLKAIISKVLSWGIRFADNKGGEKVPEEWKDDLIPIIDAALIDERELVRKLVADLLNKRIDFKKLDDEQELQAFDAFTKFLATAIDYFVQKKNE